MDSFFRKTILKFCIKADFFITVQPWNSENYLSEKYHPYSAKPMNSMSLQIACLGWKDFGETKFDRSSHNNDWGTASHQDQKI